MTNPDESSRLAELMNELREHERDYPTLIHGPLCGRAADEIDRLREALKGAAIISTKYGSILNEKDAEIARLSAARVPEGAAAIEDAMARAIMLDDGCGLTVEGERVMCDDPRAFQHVGRCFCRRSAKAAMSVLYASPLPAVATREEIALALINASRKYHGLDPLSLETLIKIKSWPPKEQCYAQADAILALRQPQAAGDESRPRD